MMKRALLCLVFTCCFSTVFAGYSDGYLTADDGYEYGFITWRSYDPPLIVDGGGGAEISVRDSGRLIVKSTSTPLAPPWDVHPGGVYDILLYNISQLSFLGGLTELITIGSSATAELKGGTINRIKSMQYVTTENIFIYAQDDWSWIDDNPLLGIEGHWLDGSSFHIEFINVAGYQPVWENIEVIPEPATLALLGLGGCLIRRRK